jgi:hypothetical protein
METMVEAMHQDILTLLEEAVLALSVVMVDLLEAV